MIPYQIRSVQLINLVRDIKGGNLISDSYFQRNLVWRETHKKDLVKTILDEFPFPLIFISKGKIDIEKMQSVSCIVDGQQRCDAIVSYIDNKFSVDGKYFRDFSEDEKSKFFKYEIPVCELDLLNDDKRVLEIFKRINRTSNSLTGIEKQASEFGASYYMLVCKLLTGQILSLADVENLDDFIVIENEEEQSNLDLDEIPTKENFRIDPNVPDEFIEWARTVDCTWYKALITSPKIFTSLEISRKVNLQYTLNILTTYLAGFYNRNKMVNEYLADYIDEFVQKDQIVQKFNSIAKYYLDLNLKNDSIWFNKANFFSLFVVFLNTDFNDLLENKESIEKNLNSFAILQEYKDYQILAKEGVNNLKERRLRNEYIEKFIIKKDLVGQ